MEISRHAYNVLEIIKQYENIVVVMHANPDGDAIGSAVGLAWFLRETLGKNVCIYNESPFPEWLKFLSLPCAYVTDTADIGLENPLVVTLDAGEVHRFGEKFAPYLEGRKSVCVDHHLGGTGFATEYNWIDHTMAATGQMVAQIVYAHSDKTTENAAKALYVALSCDTGNFTFGNTSSACIQCLAKLVDTPLHIASVREAMDNTWTEQKLHFWGRLFGMVEFAFGGRLAYVRIPSGIYAEYGVSKEDLEGFVEQMRKVKTVRMAVLLREETKDNASFVKVSMRSSGDDDVRAILARFNGGGHKNAAGAGIFGTPDGVLAELWPHIAEALEK